MASTALPRYQDTVAFSPLELPWEKKAVLREGS